VEVLLHTEVRELVGRDGLESIVVENNRTHERSVLDARSLFVFIGAIPCTAWLSGMVALDEDGFVLTGANTAAPADAWRQLEREPFVLETSCPGVFAAGDVRSGSIKRVASAVGEGAMAIRLVHEHFANSGDVTHEP
jgi:thioredoxin reductase (NADPH)